ncbi:hypothetical protein K461DRAFT_274682 [Myriangium duriaei CBS 260.36]|uniref:GST N-terminal domain-containing protein n=1 Tax=Myriangium duriaei CBS 260.36 TaxID=1168546 RepID=A0A9P4MJX0_9PEZI|nr:hypothetical protein K461DRAFT_274682 [Myriangium duriaei CBS 260.36]
MAELPPLPVLLYADPTWYPSPWRVALYLAEKRIPPSVVLAVPATDPVASKDFPKASRTFIPQLAVSKKQQTSSQRSTNPDDYIWIPQSVAIILFLEGLCNTHPELAPVGPLDSSPNPIRQALQRGVISHVEQLTTGVNATQLFGSEPYNAMAQLAPMNLPAAHAVAKQVHTKTLTKLDELLGQEGVVDCEGLESDREGAASVADIVLYATLAVNYDVQGIDLAKGYANIERHLKAFRRRKSATAGLPEGGYPKMVEVFRTGFKEEVWARAG